MASRGFSFYILPDAWIMHLPHEATDVRKKFIRDSGAKGADAHESLWQVTKRMFHEAEDSMHAGTFNATVDGRLRNAFRHCSWLREPKAAPLLDGLKH